MKTNRHHVSRLIVTIVAIAAASVMSISGQDFTFVTGPENIISSRAKLAFPGLDGNLNAIIVVTPSNEAQRANPHPIGAWYYNGKWNLFNTDHAVMTPNLVYKVHIFSGPGENRFLHVVTRDNVSEAASYIDHPALNNNPNASVTILQNYAPDDRSPYNLNANVAAAKYNPASGKWFIANVNGKTLYPNTAYNVVVETTGGQPATPQPVPTRTREPITSEPVKPIPTRTREPIAAPSTQPLAQSSSTCTNAMAHETVGKWSRQRPDDLAMADRTFPKTAYKPVLAKAQEVIELFKIANPEFKGIEARAYRGIRGQPVIPNGPVPFRVDVWYGSFICVGNDTYKVDMRGKVIVHGNYGTTTVVFNGLDDVLQSVRAGGPLLTTDGDEIREYKKDLGDFKGYPMIETSHRDSYHEAIIVASDDRLPYKPVTREQYLRARIKEHQASGGMADVIAGFNRVLGNMSPSERQSPAIVRDVSTLPGGSRLFATEAEGGKHLVTIDKSYFNPKLPRDKVQLITVRWHSSPNDPNDRPKVEMLKAFKENFDFPALWEMLGQ